MFVYLFIYLFCFLAHTFLSYVWASREKFLLVFSMHYFIELVFFSDVRVFSCFCLMTGKFDIFMGLVFSGLMVHVWVKYLHFYPTAFADIYLRLFLYINILWFRICEAFLRSVFFFKSLVECEHSLVSCSTNF